MGLTARLRGFAFARPRYLPAVAPGAVRTRLTVERTARARGWRVAESPADTDILVVCGRPDGEFATAVDRVWASIPLPRARVVIATPDEVPTALDTAAERLLAGTAAHEDHGDHDRAGRPDAADEVGMADRAADRDGLRLDVLRISFGPVLTDWPTGLTLRMDVQGDVVQRAEIGPAPPVDAEQPVVEQPDADRTAARRWAAMHLDVLGRLLAVAGHERPARHGRVLRDELLTGQDTETVRGPFTRSARRLRRSWSLRWMLRDVGMVDARTAARLDIGDALVGDVFDRLVHRLDAVEAALTDGHASRVPEPDAAAWRMPLDALPVLLAGAELAAVRLTVASLAPGFGRAAADLARTVRDG